MTQKVQVLKWCSRIRAETRKFFESEGFEEIITPHLVCNPGLELHLEHFETRYVPSLEKGLPQKLFLPTSPEYHLKRVLGEFGFERVYEIQKCFRNGETSPEHEPEFLMLEWYRSPGTYHEIARDFEKLLSHLGKKFSKNENWQNPKHISVSEAISRYVGLDLAAALSNRGRSLTEQALHLNLPSILASDDFETTFGKLMVEYIEPKLGFEGPCFLWDYPESMAALSRPKKENPLFCERFEVYWQGIELANAFGELTSSKIQRDRCEQERQKRIQKYGESPDLDENFLTSLDLLPPEVGGIAVGFERLCQCLLELGCLQDVIAFPHRNSV